MEYKIEGFELFKELLSTVYTEALKMILRVQIEINQAPQAAPSVLKESPSQPVTNVKKETKDISKVGRNDDCPCGSGKKYKKCCMN